MQKKKNLDARATQKVHLIVPTGSEHMRACRSVLLFTTCALLFVGRSTPDVASKVAAISREEERLGLLLEMLASQIPRVPHNEDVSQSFVHPPLAHSMLQ